jgi:diguanylate cyclase (GGDEF)-like protein
LLFQSRHFLIGLFAVVVAVAVFNALAVWGMATALRAQFVLQIVACLVALAVGLLVTCRVAGTARLWRASLLAAMATFVSVEVVRRFGGGAGLGATAPWPVMAAYFVAAALFAMAVLLLILLGHHAGSRPGVRTRASLLTTVLDALVSATSFGLLVYLARPGTLTAPRLPRSANTFAVYGIAAVELVVVVGVVLLAMWYPPYRPGRANYMLLAAAVIVLVSADRLLAYFRSVEVAALNLWLGIGFIVAPLLVALSVLDLAARQRLHDDELPTNWAQLTLPYLGFLGSTALLTVHVLLGRAIDPVFITGYLAMALLVATRYLVAMRMQRMLTDQLVAAKRRLAHQAHHDALTGLPNRLLLSQRLDDAIRAGPFVLIFVDIDDFKDVNDRFGHAAGDELLCAIGERLDACLASDDTLARIGGDEFAILITGALEPPETIADELRVALRNPFSVHATSIRVRASMGLVSPGQDGLAPTSDDLLRQADISMYTGKRLGKDTAVVYRPAFSVSEDFPTALRQANGGIPPGFRLRYQPIVTLPEGLPVAVEALARWTTPSGMQIPPQTFVALAEANGLGAQLDALVLDRACAEFRAARRDVDLHVNIGAARLGNAEFEGVIADVVRRHGLPPHRLVLEITETVPIVDLAEGAAAIRRLNLLGVRVALDDFGAGYNSLTYLHELPVQIVKLDRSLATGVEPGRNLTLYRSVIGLCEALGLEVIAEGVETAEQAATIREAGCGLAQGYLFGRAADLHDLSIISATTSTI